MDTGKYRPTALLDETYEVRTTDGDWLHIVRATRVDNRAMRFELSDGSKAVYPLDAPVFSRKAEAR